MGMSCCTACSSCGQPHANELTTAGASAVAPRRRPPARPSSSLLSKLNRVQQGGYADSASRYTALNRLRWVGWAGAVCRVWAGSGSRGWGKQPALLARHMALCHVQ